MCNHHHINVVTERFSTECRVKPKQLVWPITKGTENTVNQSKLEVDTCSQREARENDCERFMMDDWMKKWREFLTPIALHSVVEPITFRDSSEKNLNQEIK